MRSTASRVLTVHQHSGPSLTRQLLFDSHIHLIFLSCFSCFSWTILPEFIPGCFNITWYLVLSSRALSKRIVHEKHEIHEKIQSAFFGLLGPTFGAINSFTRAHCPLKHKDTQRELSHRDRTRKWNRSFDAWTNGLVAAQFGRRCVSTRVLRYSGTSESVCCGSAEAGNTTLNRRNSKETKNSMTGKASTVRDFRAVCKARNQSRSSTKQHI